MFDRVLKYTFGIQFSIWFTRELWSLNKTVSARKPYALWIHIERKFSVQTKAVFLLFSMFIDKHDGLAGEIPSLNK